MRKSLLGCKLLRGFQTIGPGTPLRAILPVLIVLSLVSASITATPLSASPAVTSVVPSTATAGTTVTLVGTIDTANGAYTVLWDTTSTIHSGTAAGATVNTTFAIPAAVRGAHTVALKDTAANTLSPAITVTVTPLITVNPASGPGGSSVTVTGAGFNAGEAGVTVTWDTTTAVATGVTASVTGSWTATFSLPSGATTGAHVVDAYGSGTPASLVPDATFTIITPQITISPASGKVGTSVTVSGTGFGLGETGIAVTYGGTNVKTGIVASASGTWTTTFVIPAGASGVNHPIDAGGPQTLATSITEQNFTIEPALTITPTSGTVGSTATVTGSGFRASDAALGITFDGATIKSDVASGAQGNFTTAVVIPEGPGGDRTVDAASSGTPASTVQETTFTILPRITVSPTSGSTGTQVTVTGSGFGASETGIAVTFSGSTVKDSITASARGAWTVNFTVPVTVGGSRAIDASGSSTAAGSVTDIIFTVAPKITVNPGSEAVGAKITVTGTSFSPNETGVAITYDGAIVASGIVASSNGDWSATFNVPASTTGNHRVGSYGNATAAPSVAEMPFAVSPTLTLSPVTGYAGMQIPASGTGFAAGKTVTITYDGAPVATSPGVVTTSAQGSFSASFTIPRSKSGVHKMRLSDGTTSRELDWTMENTAPAAPTVTSPNGGQRVGLFGRVSVIFAWSQVSDPSGVSYSLQVSPTPDFSTLVIKQDNLMSPTFTTGVDDLPMGTFFWRVKATDGAFNESGWTPVAQFNVGIMPIWAFILIIVVFLVVVAVVVVVLRRRGSAGEEKWWRA